MASRSYTSRAGYTSKPAFTKSQAQNMKSSTARESKKRKTDHDYDFDNEIAARNALAGISSSPPSKKARKKLDPDEEKRLRRFRNNPPQSYRERLDRVRSQRMFLIDRKRKMSEDGTHEEEVFDLAGTTGNVYQITITKVPRCTCPDNGKGNQCKHIIYVMVNVLKAREDLAYQLALLSTELSELFASAPITTQSSSSNSKAAALTTDTGGSRKPIEGDCPVCVMEFEASERDTPGAILWCKAACGQNIHRHCFEQWAKSKPGTVKCVYCRTPWKGDEETVRKITKGTGKVNAEGYVNVAGELGISARRDTSSYHQPWVRSTYRQSYGGGYGSGADDYDEY